MERENITIKIYKAESEDGFFYDIYLLAPEDIDEDTESEDGGICTSKDMRDAIEMASEQAKELLVNLDNQKHD